LGWCISCARGWVRRAGDERPATTCEPSGTFERSRTMSTGRWDPRNDLISLRDAMGNLLEEGVVHARGAGTQSAAPAGLPVDIRETPEAFTVTASVPGLQPEDVEITILGDTLRISGAQPEAAAQAAETGRWIIRERRVGPFERTVRLPTTVRSGDADAEFKEGVLTVTLPKTEEAKPRSIPVRPNQQGADKAR